LKNYNFSEVKVFSIFNIIFWSFIVFGYFLVNFGDFQGLWKNEEIQDGGSKMATI